MKHEKFKNSNVLMALGACIVIAGIPLVAASNTGPAPMAPQGQKDTITQKTGDKSMLTATKQQGKVLYADEANFAELVLASDIPVLVDFYADWCGPCRMLAPVLEELASETDEAKIVKVNVDDSPRLAARYRIRSIPSLKVFDGGKVVDEHVGMASKSQLKTMLGI
jgi:thioredoxin 1